MFRGDGRGIRIRTLNDGVRGSQSFFKTAYLSHFSDFASTKNLSEFYFCSAQQIRMRNCEHYIEEYMIMIGTAIQFAIPIRLQKTYIFFLAPIS